MVTTSYPRFPGDSVGTFMEPIAKGLAARGHEIHVVAPWHPAITRGREEDGVFFHFFKYAPLPAVNVFGYAQGMHADVRLRGAAWAAAPLALASGTFKAMRVAQKRRATIMHGHWVVPGGAMAALARPALPLVVSLHGSDVFVAERVAPARAVARRVFGRAGAVTACSPDLGRRAIALGAAPDRLDVIPYGVDTGRFAPDAAARAECRARLNIPFERPLIFSAGRLVRKKGFEYLIDALPLVGHANPLLAIAGTGDLSGELAARAAAAGGTRVIFLGNLAQGDVARWFAAADIAVVPSVRDDSGNVDGLPNTVMEALASGTPLVATPAGGIESIVEDGRTGLIVAERSPDGLARAIESVLRDPALGARLGAQARAMVEQRFGWAGVAEQFESAYDRALVFASHRR
jgi:glycosyltransferase involved in cell wall biosynthesis